MNKIETLVQGGSEVSPSGGADPPLHPARSGKALAMLQRVARMISVATTANTWKNNGVEVIAGLLNLVLGKVSPKN